jgi:hypothetical protein
MSRGKLHFLVFMKNKSCLWRRKRAPDFPNLCPSLGLFCMALDASAPEQQAKLEY